MKHTFAFAAAALTVSTLFSSCIIEKRNATSCSSSQGDTTAYFKIDDFDKIDIHGYCTFIYTQGASDSIRIEGDAQELSRVEVSQDNSELSVKWKKTVSILGINTTRHSDIRIYASSKMLSNIEMDGACDLQIDEPVTFGDLQITTSGASDIKIKDITAHDFRVSSSGASDINIDNANVKSFYTRISGAGDVDANIKNADKIGIKVSGSADADINLADCGDIDVSISGAGSISISGNARSLSKSKSGLASIDTDNLTLDK